MVGADDAGLDVAGDDVARDTPFACVVPPTASFLCIFACPFSTGPDAFLFNWGVWDAPFAPPTGRGAALGVPPSGDGLETDAVDFALGSTIDMMSLSEAIVGD